jgi:glycosyltransferase involved in cell wall biosynthesis
MTSSTPFLSIVFPAHNEEERLPETLRQVGNFIDSQPFACEVIIVENASADRTLEIAREFAENHLYTRVIQLDLPGKGRAVQAGILAARGTYRFICDVDLSMPITDIPRFLPPETQDADIVIASREAPGAVRYNEPRYRHLIGRVFNNLVRWIVLPHLQDTQCGFKCFKAEAAEALFPLQTITGWTFDVEILAVAFNHGYRIKEVPIHWYYQPRSKVNVLGDSFKMARDLLLIRSKLRRGDYDRQA